MSKNLHLSLVRSLSSLQEEKEYIDEILLDHIGLSLKRGTIVEIVGEASSGKTSVPLSLLSKLTKTGEICALVDGGNSFDPCTAFLAGVELDNLFWIKCGGSLEKAFLASDYLVQAKGFGAIWLNLNGLSEHQLRMVPKTYWYRYRNRIKETPTVLLVTATEHITGSASHRSLLFSRERTEWSGNGRFKLLRQFHISLLSQKGVYGKPLQTKIKMDYTDV